MALHKKAKFALGALVVLALLATVAVVTWKNRAAPHDGELIKEVTAKARPVETVVLAPEVVAVNLEVAGVLASRRDVVVSAEVGGTVRAVTRQLGEPCPAGEFIATLDGEPYRIGRDQARAQVAQAEAARDNAARELERQRRLEASAGVTASQLDAAETGLEAAAAVLDQARAGLRAAARSARAARIRCPFDGHVAQLMVEVGAMIAPLTPVARIVDLDDLELTVAATAAQLSRIREGQPVRLGEPGARARPWAGAVVRIGVAADPQTRMFPVVVALAAAQRGPRVGQVLAATFELARHDAALAVPVDAVLDADGAPAVLRVEGEAVRKVAVELAERVGERWVVGAGLAAGDRIVTVGGEGLTDGAKVRVVGPPESGLAAAR